MDDFDMQQKYVVFTGSCYALPIIQLLAQQHKLAGVVVPEGELNPDLQQLQSYLSAQSIHIAQYTANDSSALIAQLDVWRVTDGVIYLFRHIVHSSLCQFFNGNLYNIHPGKLPEYRGPMPLYWQLREGLDTFSLTLHRLEASADSGAIGMELEVPFHPLETLTSAQQKASQMTAKLMYDFLIAQQKQGLVWREQVSNPNEVARAVNQHDLHLRWNVQTSREIVNLVRAGNHDFGGAMLSLPSGVANVLQASAMETSLVGVEAGRILEISPQHGLQVKTLDSAISIDVIATPQGVFSGYRYAQMAGLDAGMSLLQHASACE
ncbi:hypothetical protein Q4905_000372 [Vibrio alginolyticus]|nr:hypothetical protein [Vibrio alginolyticus]ELB2280691.1 hypothetical protein [Vibrio alginolyticus]ELH9638554.1 hypothetical protein [Vibrio alginolyticus]EMC8462080.1 hypothetical protein [Vibrio alginolyticus]EME3935457.1 hypothetical protein [Vibrio alginolyticus]